MADLTFANVNAAATAPFITATGATLTIDCAALMGETAIALSDAKVSEFATRLLDAFAAAQSVYNVANPLAPLAGFPPSLGGVPELDAIDSKYYVTTTHSVATRAPLDKAQTTGVLA
jgi:hypothetical protein